MAGDVAMGTSAVDAELLDELTALLPGVRAGATALVEPDAPEGLLATDVPPPFDPPVSPPERHGS